MILKEIKNKESYFKKHYPFRERPKLTDKKYCIHCSRVITVGDYKVEIENGIEYIVCPYAPKCNGTVADWMSVKYK